MSSRIKSSNIEPKYKRFINYKLNWTDQEFERRNKRSFHKWMRRKINKTSKENT